MTRIPRNKWHTVNHLITDENPFVNIAMAFDRRWSGEVWVDRLPNPAALVAIVAHDAWAWGDLNRDGVRDLLGNFTGTIPDAPGLERILADVWGDFIRIPTLVYRHERRTGGPSVPPGFSLEAITAENVAKTHTIWPGDAAGATIGHFPNYPTFFKYGYGYMVLDEASGACVSACAAISVAGRRVDHGLDTLFAYERRGLGTLCAHATVEEGIRRGLQPVWLAAHGNEGSHRVATKIGFVPAHSIMLFERLV